MRVDMRSGALNDVINGRRSRSARGMAPLMMMMVNYSVPGTVPVARPRQR